MGYRRNRQEHSAADRRQTRLETDEDPPQAEPKPVIKPTSSDLYPSPGWLERNNAQTTEALKEAGLQQQQVRQRIQQRRKWQKYQPDTLILTVDRNQDKKTEEDPKQSSLP